nr:response regulator [uncultured Holophaga sp.]
MHLRPILLVEDNPQDEMLTLRALEKARIANPIEVARDGQQALDRLLDPSAPLPCVVLLDLGLPRIGGIEVLTRVREESRTRLLPVAILTSSDEEQDRLRCWEGGANSFVRKPVDFAEFAETVSRVGTYWALVNEPPQLPEDGS